MPDKGTVCLTQICNYSSPEYTRRDAFMVCEADNKFLLFDFANNGRCEKVLDIIKKEYSNQIESSEIPPQDPERCQKLNLIIIPLTQQNVSVVKKILDTIVSFSSELPPTLFICEEPRDNLFNLVNSVRRSDIVDCHANSAELSFRIQRLLNPDSESNHPPLHEMLSGIFNQIQEKVMIVDKQHRIVFVNPGLAALIGKQPEEMIGEHCYNFRGLLCGNEHDHETPRPCGRCRKPIDERPHITKAFFTDEGEKYFEISTYPVHPPKFEKPFSLRCFKDVTGRVLLEKELRKQADAIAQIVEERTQKLKETKEYLEKILEATHDFLFTLNLNGEITYLNRNVCKLGYTTKDLLGKKFTTFIPDATFQNFFSSIVKKKEPSSLQIDFLTKDDQMRPHILDAYPLFEGNHRVIGVLGVGRDITEKKAMEAQLLENAKFSFLGQIATGLAHEIKNPLAVIEGTSAYCIKREPDTKRLKESFLVINRNVVHAQKILNDLLDFARPKPLKTRSLKINTVIKRAMDLVAIDLERSNVQLKLSLCSPSPMVSCDEKRLNQVFFDLIWNARQAMPNGGELQISSSSSLPPLNNVSTGIDGSSCERRGNKSFVKISFSDSGIGIDKDSLKRVFDPFYTSKPKGLGLGLSICKRIIEAHGGTITAESQLGKGTTVSIFLPEEE